VDFFFFNYTSNLPYQLIDVSSANLTDGLLMGLFFKAEEGAIVLKSLFSFFFGNFLCPVLQGADQSVQVFGNSPLRAKSDGWPRHFVRPRSP
jgi:hypothetical protein